MMQIKAGSTSVTAARFAAYTTATGAAVAVTSATTGLALWYKRVDGTRVAITPIGDLAAEDAAYTAKAIRQIDGQEHRLDAPDAAYAVGSVGVQFGGSATGITIDGCWVDLIGQANTATDVSHLDGTAVKVDDPPPTKEQIRAEIDANSTKQGYKLHATGLDLITATEPTGRPTTFPGWIMWLVQRFRRSTKSATEIVVKTEAGAVVTTQAITSSGDDQTLGPPT